MATMNKPFDFSKYPKQKIAIMFMYFGWEFEGLVQQENTLNTVEQTLFQALLKTKLIDDPKNCYYTRCGRTDKGVSAFRQVASLIVRCTSINEQSLTSSDSSSELPYLKMLNGVLPSSIRILAYSIVSDGFHSRHSCSAREYIYFLPRGKIQLKQMNDACKLLVGSHDFRNFCHFDNNHDRIEMSYVRTIFSAKVDECVSTNPSPNEYDLLKLSVKASGFLWHQIRAIVSLIYEVAIGNENIETISELLDIQKNPARPHYNLANHLPLCLFECTYPHGILNWIYDTNVLRKTIEKLQNAWAEYQIKATMVKTMINEISAFSHQELDGLEQFILACPNGRSRKYIPVNERPKCDSLEFRREKLRIKRNVKVNDR